MLGAPVSLEAKGFGVARDVGGMGQGIAHVAPFGDMGKVEQGKLGHAFTDGGDAANSNTVRGQIFYRAR